MLSVFRNYLQELQVASYLIKNDFEGDLQVWARYPL